MSDIKDIGSIFGVLEDLENVKLAEEQMAIKQQQFNEAQKLKFEASEKTKNYNLTKENLNDRREENEVEIARLVKEIANWNIVAQDWSLIDDKYGKGKTEDGKALLKELGLVYGENFKFKEAASLDYAEQLNNTQNLITLQEEIINDLTSKQNEILRLHDDWAKVGTEAGIKAIKDTDDVKAYIKENPQKFLKPSYTNPDGSQVWGTPPSQGSGLPYQVPRIDEDGNITLQSTTLADELNPLGKALMKEKMSPTDKYGFVDKSAVDTALAALDTSMKTEKEEIKQSWNDEASIMFKDVASTEQLLKNDDDFLVNAGGRVANYEGREELYSDPAAQEQLISSLQDKIMKTFLMSAKKEKSFRNTDIMEKINAMEGKNFKNKVDLMKQVHDLVIPSGDSNEPVYGYEDKIWKSEEMEDIDLVDGLGSQKSQELILKKWLSVFGRLHNKLYN